MGFCIYNNCAVGAHYLIEKFKYKRIAIWDPDVHQGNGHQDIFWDNKNVLYLSTHQYPFYPGTGSEKEKVIITIFLTYPCLQEQHQKNILMHIIEF